MMSFLNPILAQAAAVPQELTVGSVITALMFLATAVGSMAMIVVWVIRHSQTGHALPAARRGVLRVPLALTLVAVVLSVLFMLMVLASSLVDPIPVASNVVAGKPAEVDSAKRDLIPARLDDATTIQTPTTEPVEPSSEVKENTTDSTSDASEVKDATTSAPKKSTIDPEQMKSALIQTIVMDIMMLLAFGAVVLVASKAGRVYLEDENRSANSRSSPSHVTQTAPQHSSRTGGAAMGARSAWPDLDDASSIPNIQGYDILGNRAERDTYGMESEANSSEGQPASPVSQQPSRAQPFNTFVAGHEEEPLGIAQETDEPRMPDESFSFIRELRFAAEVFLAAYLPTTALRLLIVLISMSIMGEPPKSHPFLEMLEAGASVAMIAMILVMAVFVAPVVEELQFRVVVLGGIAQLGWPKLALFGSSILFAFAHGFPDSIALIPLALALGYTYLRRRSYVTVMLVHFLFNGFNMVLALVALL